MIKLLKIDDCYFYFPDKNKNYHLISIKNGKIYCNNRWKEIKLYDDKRTNLIDICEMLVNYQLE